MKLFNKCILCSILAGVIAFGNPYNGVAASPVNSQDDFVVRVDSGDGPELEVPLLDGIGNVTVKNNVVIYDVSIPLYATFDSQEDALDRISTNPVIKCIHDFYDLDDISDDNWMEYYDKMLLLLNSEKRPNWYNEEDKDFNKVRVFFDIYENDEKNKNIISNLYKCNSLSDLKDSQDGKAAILSLPSDSYATIVSDLDIDLSLLRTAGTNSLGFNIDSGVSYASTYAVNPNTPTYKDFGGNDCTNFTSQILENGGVSQEVYSDESKGWWHTTSKLLGITTHKHSISWIKADTFAKYMGVGYTTTSNSSFSNNIQRGDFIAADYGNDGDWNHMGFITKRNSAKTNGYYDYKVAQHSSNYHEWASSTDNGWDNIGTNGGKYGRVRR